MATDAPTPLTEQYNILELDLGVDGGRVVFKGLEEIAEWVKRERESIAWMIANRLHKDPAIGEAYNKLNEHVGAMEAHLLSAHKQAGVENYGGVLAQFKAVVEGAYRNNGYLPQSPLRSLVDRVRASDSAAAGYMLALKLNTFRWPPNGQAPWRALAHWIAFLAHSAGEATYSEALKDSDAARRSEWNTFLDAARQDQQALHNEVVELSREGRKNLSDHAQAHSEQLAELNKAIEAALSAHTTDVNDALGKTKEDLVNLRDAYEQHMQLKAAVTYWAEQEEKHGSRARWFGVFAGTWAALSIGILLFCGPYIFPLTEDGQRLVVPLLEQPPWRLLSLGLAVMLMIWMQRILVRITLSHVHLGTDAGERVTIAKAYMALVKEGAAPPDERRAAVFATLFRPSSTGILKDDAAPAVPLELLSRLTSGRT